MLRAQQYPDHFRRDLKTYLLRSLLCNRVCNNAVGNLSKVYISISSKATQWEIDKQKVHLFDELDTGGEIHAEIDEVPVDAFLLVDLLLQHEHVVVEELLQTLVRVVDAQLLERVVLQANETATESRR